MAVANRSAKLRGLSGKLTEQFGLSWRQGIEAEYDESRREWTYAWTDGPTIEQVRRAARKAEPEAIKDVRFVRRLSDATYVLGVLRMALAHEPLENDFRGPRFTLSEIEEHFAKIKNPAPKAGREATIVDNLLKVSEGHGSGWWDAGDRVADYTARNGFSRALTGVELTPLEELTARYAQGSAERAWRYRLVPLTTLEAFGALQADAAAPPEIVAAGLTLVPELHAALDTAAAELTARLGTEAPTSEE